MSGGGVPSGEPSKDNTFKEGVSGKTILSVDASGDLSRSKEARNGLEDPRDLAEDLSFGVHLHPSHGIVKNRSDGAKVESLVVLEGDWKNCLAKLVLLVTLGGLAIVRKHLLDRGLRNSEVGGKPSCSRDRVAKALDVCKNGKQGQVCSIKSLEERTLVPLTAIKGPRCLAELGHGLVVHDNKRGGGRVALDAALALCKDLLTHMISAPKLVHEPLSLLVQEDASAATEGLWSKKLDWVQGILRVNKASRVHLDLVHVDELDANGTAHSDAIATGESPVGGGEVGLLGGEFNNERVLGPVAAKASSAHHHAVSAQLFFLQKGGQRPRQRQRQRQRRRRIV